MAGQVRQIKIVVLAYAIVSLSITIGSTAYFASNAWLPDEYSQSQEGEHSQAQESVGPSENDPLPPISLTDASGRLWSNPDLDGKAVLLNFWATWCGPCRKEMPILDKMQQEYESRGFTVLAVSLDREGWDVVRPYMAGQEWSFPVFVADSGVEREFGKISTLPTTYFVRPDGTIDTKHVGGLSESHIVRHVESLLGGESGKDADAAGTRDIDEFSPARMIGFVAPQLTGEGLDAGVTGPVEVELLIKEDGSVHDIEVIHGVGMGLDERMIEAVQPARFEPAMKAGKPISARMKIRVGFSARNVGSPHDPNK